MESEVGRTSTNAMMKTHKIFYVLAILSATCANTQQLPVGSLLNISETPAHDPVMIKQDSIYYIFLHGNWNIRLVFAGFKKLEKRKTCL